jgi:hypothetical protein
MSEVDICNLVADCIDNNPDVQSALSQYITNNIPVPVVGSDRGTEVVVDECNLDRRWGASLGIVQSINQSIVDTLELVDTQADVFSRASLLVSAVPALGLAPFDEVIEAANLFADSLLSQYNAAYTATLEDELACLIFCNVTGCTITFDTVYDAFISELTLPTFNTLFAVLDFLVAGGYTGANLVKALFTAVVAFAKFSDVFFGGAGNAQTIINEGRIGAEILASSGHLTACACPGSWCYEFDFTASDGGWSVTPNSGGTWVSGTGWNAQSGTYLGRQRTIVDIENTAPSNATIDYIEIEFDYVQGNVNTSFAVDVRDNSQSFIQVAMGSQSNGTGLVLSWSGSATVDTKIRAFVQAAIDGTNGSATIKRLKFEGTGANPFGSDNC